MNPKQFLLVGGSVLVLVAILGFMGIIGPTAQDSLFSAAWYFDNAENWAHLVLGVVALIAAFVFPATLHKPLVMVVGVLGIIVGLYSAIGPVTQGVTLLGANLQNPTDTVLHLAIGAWALWAAMRKPAMMAAPM